jgi:hypothetical protein
MSAMPTELKLSHTAAMILQAIEAGFVYGFSIMEMTGLPSGTVYPAMRRLERVEATQLLDAFHEPDPGRELRAQ